MQLQARAGMSRFIGTIGYSYSGCLRLGMIHIGTGSTVHGAKQV
jgi:hypothetical protein